jgi:hypothetical protein
MFFLACDPHFREERKVGTNLYMYRWVRGFQTKDKIKSFYWKLRCILNKTNKIYLQSNKTKQWDVDKCAFPYIRSILPVLKKNRKSTNTANSVLNCVAMICYEYGCCQEVKKEASGRNIPREIYGDNRFICYLETPR